MMAAMQREHLTFLASIPDAFLIFGSRSSKVICRRAPVGRDLAGTLLTSTLERILQFFLAIAADEEDIHTSAWSNRKEFMWRMREDLGQDVTFTGKNPGNKSISMPTLDQVFFKPAYQEMTRRSAIPHSADPIPIFHGSTLALHCAYCGNQE